MRVSRSLAARVGAVVATAAVAVSGAAAVANAATPAAKVKTPTTLVAVAGPGHIRHHRYPHTVAWIAGQLTSSTTTSPRPVTGVRVFLKRETAKGHWYVVEIGRTGRYGKVRFRVHALRKGASFELVFRGNRKLEKSASNVVTIAPVTS
jgi:hypothetical protein